VVGAVVYVALLTLIPVHMKMKTSRTPKLEDQIRDARRKRAQAAQAKIEPQ
jgi:F0F1-type ATP synthase membrane subunit b/b'